MLLILTLKFQIFRKLSCSITINAIEILVRKLRNSRDSYMRVRFSLLARANLITRLVLLIYILKKKIVKIDI